MQYSPKLKIAMDEIKTILKKHDIAGLIILHTVQGQPIVKNGATTVDGFAEFLYHINTSYSAATIENDRFKVKGKSIHYPSKAVRDEKVAGAVNMLEHFKLWTKNFAEQSSMLDKLLSDIVEKENNDPGTTSSYTQQNN